MPHRTLVSDLARARIAVIGDIILDHYVEGEVGRVSEEAPVPILLVRRERQVLGGAANVAANIAAMGGAASLFGVVGEDFPGRSLSRLLEGFGPRLSSHVLEDAERSTIVKTRYIGGAQQIVRVDREDSQPISQTISDHLLAELESRIGTFDVIVLSDYGKGALTDYVLSAVLRIAQTHGKTAIVDPKRRDLTAYRGATYLTPNRKELAAATRMSVESDNEAAAAAAVAMKECGASILLTRSEKGMSLFRNGAAPLHVKSEARQVFDVSGAGDTVVAALAAGLASGAPLEHCMRLANVAAGLVIAKSGTAVVTKEELLPALARVPSRGENEIVIREVDALVARREAWREQGLVVGFTNGCFDLLHPGHISLLSQAARQCDRLIVALNNDESVRGLKGPTRPVQHEQARLDVVAAVKGVDAVTLFGDETPLTLIEALKPDVLIKGADYQLKDVVGGAEVIAAGGRVYLAELVEGQSTSALIAKSNLRDGSGG